MTNFASVHLTQLPGLELTIFSNLTSHIFASSETQTYLYSRYNPVILPNNSGAKLPTSDMTQFLENKLLNLRVVQGSRVIGLK